jgi:uncharacterized protein YwgA
MKKLQRAAVLVSLVKSLRENKSWCGETSVQKAAYFLQELLEVPLDFDFVLYKYGPYSFELSEELTSLCADSFLDLEIRDSRYSPSYLPGEMEDFLFDKFPKTAKRFREQVEFVSVRLGNRHVPELERLATALYVRLAKEDVPSVKKRAAKIRKLKPHVSESDAREAIEEVDEMFTELSKLN